MQYTYIPLGICAKLITFDIDDNKVVTNVQFTGGCNGNQKAIASLIDGMTADEIRAKLEHIRCGNKPTSCAHQLCFALKQTTETDE